MCKQQSNENKIKQSVTSLIFKRILSIWTIEAWLFAAVDIGIVLLAEGVGTDEQTDVDEAITNMAVSDGKVTIGQTGTPFGAFEICVLSDPLTLSLSDV